MTEHPVPAVPVFPGADPAVPPPEPEPSPPEYPPPDSGNPASENPAPDGLPSAPASESDPDGGAPACNHTEEEASDCSSPDLPASEAEKPPLSGERVRPAAAWFRIVVPWTLAGIAALVFVSAAAAAVAANPPTEESVVPFLLGSLFGGRGSIVAVNPEDAAASPSEPLLLPGEKNADERKTLLSEPGDEPAGNVPDEALNSGPTGPAEEQDIQPPPPQDPKDSGHPDGNGSAPTVSESVLRFTNETGYAPDPDELLSAGRAVPTLAELKSRWGEDAPLVLILHTHGTEAFRECEGGDYRSRDPSLSVLALGKLLADKLNEAGIPAIRLTELFDAPDFSLAYYNAAQAIKKTLGEYPSVSYILDIHRDSMVLTDGTVLAPVTEIDGERTAQLMLVVGTDEAGAEHPGWRDNLSLALRLQTALTGKYPTLMRDINLRSASFNEQYAKGALLIEAGSTGCTLGETETAVRLFADALIGEIRGE